MSYKGRDLLYYTLDYIEDLNYPGDMFLIGGQIDGKFPYIEYMRATGQMFWNFEIESKSLNSLRSMKVYRNHPANPYILVLFHTKYLTIGRIDFLTMAEVIISTV